MYFIFAYLIKPTGLVLLISYIVFHLYYFIELRKNNFKSLIPIIIFIGFYFLYKFIYPYNFGSNMQNYIISNINIDSIFNNIFFQYPITFSDYYFGFILKILNLGKGNQIFTTTLYLLSIFTIIYLLIPTLKKINAIKYIFYLSMIFTILICGQILYKQIAWNKLGFGFNYNKFTDGIADFIVDNQLEGKMFNSFFLGSYLLWKLYPQHQVFIDTRSQTYGGELLTNYYFLLKEPHRWSALEKKYNFQFAVLRYPEIIPNGQEANNYMNLFPKDKWGLAYFDQSGFILVRRDGPNKRLADNYKYINPFAKNNINYLNYYIQENKTKEVMDELQRAIKLNDKNSYAHFQMAYLYAQTQPTKIDSIVYHLKKTNEIEPVVGKELLKMYLGNK